MFTLLLAFSTLASAQTTGILGVRYTDGSVATWAVTDEGEVTRLGSGIAVPTAQGWAVVDRMTMSRAPDATEDVLRIGPAGHLPALPGPCAGDDVDNVRTETPDASYSDSITILSVSPTLLTYEVSGNAWTGGAHPGAWDDVYAVAIPSGTAVAFGDVFKGQDAAFMMASNARSATMTAEERWCFEGDASEWALVRSGGHWVARGRFAYGPQACRGASLDFTVPIAIPASVTGPDRLVDRLPAGAIDEVQSPDGLIDVLVTPAGLTISAPDEEGLVIARAGAQIVMAQWATGDAAVRWPMEAMLALEAPR